MTKKRNTPVVKLEEEKTAETKPVETSQEQPKKVIDKEEIDASIDPIDILLSRLENDVKEEQALDQDMETLREVKKEISDRVRDGVKYFSHLMDSATPEQQEKMQSFGVKTKKGKKELNQAGQIALSIMAKEKEPITNEQLYNKYLALVPEGDLPDTYPQFNVHLRAPERSGVLKRTMIEGSKTTRDALISYHPEASTKYGVAESDN